MFQTITLALTAILSLLSFTSCASAASMDHMVRFQKRGPSSKYPAINVTPPQSSLPKDWVDALNAAVSAGKIPDISPSTATSTGVSYSSNKVGNSEATCSWTVSKCNGPDDITDAPDGEWTIAFDDGPTAASPALYKFLQQNNQSGTHFMIGSQILSYPNAFQDAIATDQEVALHTWSHSLLTTKSNLDVVAELGWNMQIIYDMSGRVPQLYRPPQGDVDARVRAIAKEIFGLTAVMWNAECNDWCLDNHGHSACPGEVPGQSRGSVASAIKNALNRPKSPGVSILEHELNDVTVGLFTDYYPSLATLGWKAQAVSDHYGQDWYANAKGNFDTAANVSSFVVSDTTNTSPSTSTSSSPSTPTQDSNTHNITSNASNLNSTASLAPSKQSSVAGTTSGSTRLSLSVMFAIVSTGLAAILTTI